MIKKPFLLFDATPYLEKPKDLRMKKIRVVYESSLWGSSDNKDVLPTEAKLYGVMQSIINEPSIEYVILDIEHWPLTTSQRHRDQLLTIMRLFKEQNPQWKIGNYAICPRRNHTHSLLPPSDQLYQAWVQDNQSTDSIAKSSDVLCPSLYAMYPDVTRWERYAVENISETKRLYWPQKPIIPFIWPQYHNTIPQIGLRYLDKSYWQTILMTVWRQCDGAIIWKNWTNPLETWNHSLPWVLPTEEFITEYIQS